MNIKIGTIATYEKYVIGSKYKENSAFLGCLYVFTKYKVT